jgi:hypothetical protein
LSGSANNNGGGGLRESWIRNLKSKKMSKKEKFMRIREKAREIEEMALRKEQLLNVKGAIDHYGNLSNLNSSNSA